MNQSIQTNKNLSILITGILRNAENSIQKDFDILNKSTSSFKKKHFYFVESDSSDTTLSILENIKQSLDSISNQFYENFNLYLINLSTKQISTKFSSIKINVIKKQNEHKINEIISQIDSDFIGFLHKTNDLSGCLHKADDVYGFLHKINEFYGC